MARRDQGDDKERARRGQGGGKKRLEEGKDRSRQERGESKAMVKIGLDMRIGEARKCQKSTRRLQGEDNGSNTRKTAIDLLIINYKESQRG